MWRIIFRKTFYPHLAYAAWVYAVFWAVKTTSLDQPSDADFLRDFSLLSIFALPFAMIGMYRWTRHTLRLTQPSAPRRLTVWRVVRTVGVWIAVVWLTLLCVGAASGGGWKFAGTTILLVEAVPAVVCAFRAGLKGHFQEEGEIESQQRAERAVERAAQAEVNKERRRIAREEAQARACQRADESAIRDAYREAERFCAKHAKLLKEEMPPAVLRTHLADLRAMTEPNAARAAARELIAQLQPVVERAAERRREVARERALQEERCKELRTEIASFEAQAEKIRASGLDADVIEDEVAGIQHHISELRDQLKMLGTLQHEGDLR